MSEEYSKNGRKTAKIEYKGAEDKAGSPMEVSESVMGKETYRTKTETVSPENTQKPEIKREGEKRCWCGSGKKFENCHGKHLRVDKNPGAAAKDYEIKLNVRSIDEYETPDSVKEYEKKNGEPEELKKEDLLRIDEQGEIKGRNDYNNKERDKDRGES